MTTAELEQFYRGSPPLPLTVNQANAHALWLHERGFSYNQISLVMGLYHGHWYGRGAWRNRCCRRGAKATTVRGYARV